MRVPLGVVVKAEDGTVLCDLSTPGQRFVAAAGGRADAATSTSPLRPGGAGARRARPARTGSAARSWS